MNRRRNLSTAFAMNRGRAVMLHVLLGLVITLPGAHVTLASQRVSQPDERAELQKIREDLRRAEAQIEVLRRLTPPEFDRTEEERSLRKLAGVAKLSNLKIRFPDETSRLPLEDGTPSPMELHGVELSGRHPFGNIQHFLSMLDHRPRFARLETLRLVAADKETVRFTARLVLPILTDDPQGEPSLRDGILASEREQLARKRAIVWTISQYLDPARREHVPVALALLEDEIGTRPIALTETSFDGNLTLRGVLVGAAARAAMKDGLEKAGLRAIREEFSRAGICQAFTIIARPEPGDRPPEAVVGNGMFDAGTSTVCKRELAPLAERVVVGASPADGSPPFLRLREVDLADVFSALSDLLSEGFVVDPDVTGRVSVDVSDNASVDEIFVAMRIAGARVGPGPVRRVSRKETEASIGTSDLGSPVSFKFKDVAVSDVLCLIGQISERDILVPPDQNQGRISIFAIEAPLNHLLDAVIGAADLSSVSEGKRLVLQKRGDPREVAGVNVCETRPASSPSRLDNFPAFLPEIGTADIQLAGLAHLSESWRAYVYGPARRLMPVEAGYELFDATVKSVGPDGIKFTMRDGKPLSMALRK